MCSVPETLKCRWTTARNKLKYPFPVVRKEEVKKYRQKEHTVTNSTL
jgi:hypothetical protein